MANSRTSQPRGLYRERSGSDADTSVYLSYGRHGFSISADRYVHDGHSPAFNSLPWKEDYDAARPQSDGGDLD